MRKWEFLHVACLALGLCVGVLLAELRHAMNTDRGNKPRPVWKAETIRVDRPEATGRAITRLRVVHVEQFDRPVKDAAQPPRTDPARTWTITVGRIDQPGYFVFTAESE